MRSASPKAAVVLPLPGPVLTISRPFSTVLPATSASCTALRLAILARWRSSSFSSIRFHHFTLMRQSRDHEEHRSATAATRWLSRPVASRNRRPSAIVGHDAQADLVGDHEPRPARRDSTSSSSAESGLDVVFGQHMVGQPQRQAVDQDRPAVRQRRERAGEIERRVDGRPALAAPRPVQRDALAHLVVIGLRRGDIGPRRRQRRDQLLGMRALAGARTAENEGQACA